MNNPFTERHMIKDSAKFFGRKEQIHHIINRLKHLQSVSIVGERRIGKSSLLYHLYQTGSEWLGANYRFLYVNLQDVRNHTNVDGLFSGILKELAIRFSPQKTVQRNLTAFSEAVGKFKDQGTNLVLLFDEFEELIQHREVFSEDFFDQMRTLIDNGVMGMVTSSQASLRTLCLDGNFSSPLYNVFSRVDLKEFNEEEAENFIIANREIPPFSQDEICFIMSYPQFCYPIILQIICYWVIENRTKNLPEETLEEEIKNDAKEFFAKGLLAQTRRHKGDILKGGKKLWELVEEIIKKKVGGEK